MNSTQDEPRRPLPVEVLVGQLFMVQPNPLVPPRETLKEHESHYFGSFMVRPENLPSVEEGRALTRLMRTYWRRLPPPLVGMDEEGGLVSDAGHLTAAGPSAQALGHVDDVDVTKDVYESMGRKLKALGVNTVFAPVLDVNTNPRNPVIGTRSFSSDVDVVRRHARAALDGLREAHVAACVKHFPGHGDTAEDSHLALPVVKADRDMLMHREILPFAEVIDSSHPPDMVMTAHVAYPGLDNAKRPATWSKAILRDLLRGELRFNGVVISDAMEMRALAALAPEEAALDAVNAGVDVLLYAQDREMAVRAYEGLVQAVNSGRLPRDRVEESVERIFALRKRMRGERWINDRDAAACLDMVENQVLYETALESLVMEGNLGALSDLHRVTGRKLMVLPLEVGGRPLAVEMVREQLEPHGFTVVTVPADPAPGQVEPLARDLDPQGAVIVATASRGPLNDGTRTLVDRLTSRDMVKIGVALMDPGDADAMMQANCRIKTLGASQPQLWALCQKLIP